MLSRSRVVAIQTMTTVVGKLVKRVLERCTRVDADKEGSAKLLLSSARESLDVESV